MEATMGSLLFDTDYANLATALSAAAGRILVISDDHSITTAHTVPAGTHLLGEGGSITMTQPDTNALVIGGDGVTIEGVEIVGPASPDTPSDVVVSNGIYAEGRDNLTVTDCLIRRFDSCGIFIRGCRNTTLRDNRLHSNRYGLGDSSDICLYSSDPPGGRIVIEGNFCLSNNSQGIYVDALGHDDDVTVAGNACVATDGGGDELAAVSVVRRHGIIIGYGSPVEGNGRVAVTGNLCRNTAVTGIYVASNAELRRAVVIVGNVCSLNGLAETALAGGIFITGGGLGTLVANNAVFDFRGNPAYDVGCLVVNHNVAGATATLSGNLCDTSTADGIVLKAASAGVRVTGNRTHAIARYDVAEITIADNPDAGGHRIERNEFLRTNSDAPSVKIDAQASTRTTYVLDNVIEGFDKTDEDDANAGIALSGGVNSKPFVATGNVIRQFRYGILYFAYVPGRYDSLLRFDRNEIEDCHGGIVLAATSPAAVMVVEGNWFRSVTNPLSTCSGLGGYVAGYVGRRDSGRLVLLGLNAAPTIGTWAVGDRAEFTTPTAGGTIGAVCTGAGNPGMWKAYGAIAA
jgi:parallel beta-helix repeat protein